MRGVHGQEQSVRVKVSDVLSALKKSKETHEKIYKESLEGFKTKSIIKLKTELDKIERGELATVSVHLPKPVSHAGTYTRLISMFEMTIDTEIELTETQFSSYVMNDWEWMGSFLTSNAGYSATARRMSESYNE